MRSSKLVLSTLLVALGCSDRVPTPGSRGDARPMDAAPSDGAQGDGGGGDVLLTDVGLDDTGPRDTGPGDTGGIITVPDPGTQMGIDWADVEPNNTAAQATPIGILNNPAWLGFASPASHLESNTDTDFYVFRTGAAVDGISIQACWSGGIDLLDIFLYSVINSELGVLIKSAQTTDTTCETLIASGMAAVDLSPNSTYVVEFRAAPGLNLGGNDGMYGA